MENINQNEATQAENNTGGSSNQQSEKSHEGKEDKLFTQEEVNSFIQARFSRMKAQLQKEAQAEYSQKLEELNAYKMNLMLKERLIACNMPTELADVISCKDEADIDAKINVIQKLYGGKTANEKEVQASGFLSIGVANKEHENGPDPIRKAMGLK